MSLTFAILTRFWVADHSRITHLHHASLYWHSTESCTAWSRRHLTEIIWEPFRKRFPNSKKKLCHCMLPTVSFRPSFSKLAVSSGRCKKISYLLSVKNCFYLMRTADSRTLRRSARSISDCWAVWIWKGILDRAIEHDATSLPTECLEQWAAWVA